MQPSPGFLAALNKVKSQLGLKTLQSVLVVHCAHAYAAVLEGEAGWKLVFSGDTRPCDQLVAAAQDATLLIHEVWLQLLSQFNLCAGPELCHLLPLDSLPWLLHQGCYLAADARPHAECCESSAAAGSSL